MRHGQCTRKTILHNIIISRQFRKNAVFRVITEVTENLVKVKDRQIYDTLLSEQFSTHFGVCFVVTRSIVKFTDANKREFRQKSYQMLILY